MTKISKILATTRWPWPACWRSPSRAWRKCGTAARMSAATYGGYHGGHNNVNVNRNVNRNVRVGGPGYHGGGVYHGGVGYHGGVYRGAWAGRPYRWTPGGAIAADAAIGFLGYGATVAFAPPPP